MKKTIPARTLVVCDSCLKECSESMRKKSAQLKMDAAGLDYSGCPVGPGGFSLDLCDSCCGGIEEVINTFMVSKRESQPKPQPRGSNES